MKKSISNEIKKFLVVASILSFFYLPIIVLGGETTDGIISNPLSVETIADLLKAVLDIVVQIGVVVVTLGIIYSGFLLVKARGNPGEIKTARDSIIWTLVGAAIVLGAFVIAEVVRSTVGQLTEGVVSQVDYQLINKV